MLNLITLSTKLKIWVCKKILLAKRIREERKKGLFPNKECIQELKDEIKEEVKKEFLRQGHKEEDFIY